MIVKLADLSVLDILRNHFLSKTDGQQWYPENLLDFFLLPHVANTFKSDCATPLSLPLFCW